MHSLMKTRQDNDVTDHASVILAKMKLNCLDRYECVSFVMKTRQHNDMTDHTGVVYTENNTCLS